MRKITLGFMAMLLAAAPALAGEDMKAETAEAVTVATVGEAAPDFTLTDANGKEHKLSAYRGSYVVLEWVNFDCPFVRKHYGSGNMQKLQAAYQDKDVVWLSICSSAPGKQGYFAGEDLTERLEAEGLHSTAYLIDADGTVGRMYEAKTTPDMYVIDPDGKLIYAGAIDDRPSTKPADIEGANNYVVQTLDASMAGEEVEVTWTKSYGCSVKYDKK